MRMNRILTYFRIRPKTVVLLILLLICFYLMTLHRKDSDSTNSNNIQSTDKNTIHLAIVVCGAVNRIFKLFPLIKSAIFLSESPIHFHFVVEDLPKQNIEKFYEELPYLITERVTFIYYETWFPEEDHNWWLTAYKRCASQKIFLQTVLKDVEKVIYLDTDTLIVHQLEEIWRKFDDFEPQHVIGATPDCPFYGCAYYKKPIGQKTHVPVVWDAGLNAGVIFMRLDRMREFKFQEKLIEYAVEYKDRLLFHEQDLINILFTNYIDNLLHVDCSYNYFPMVYCSQSTPCNKLTIKIAHGYLNQFEINQSLFQMISLYILNVNILDEKSQILKELKKRIEVHVSSDNCQVIKKNIFID